MAANAPAIGIVGSDDLAASFTALGFRVLTGDGFRAGATAVSNALSGKDPAHDGSPFPIVLIDTADPFAKPWVKLMSRQSPRLIVVASGAGGDVLGEEPDNRLEAPATVNDLLTKIGYQHTPAALGAKYIQADGSLGDNPPSEQPAPALTTLLPAALPSPTPEPEATLSPAEVLDSFEGADATPAANDVPLDALFQQVAQSSEPVATSPIIQASEGSLDDLFTSATATPAVTPVTVAEPGLDVPEYAPLTPQNTAPVAPPDYLEQDFYRSRSPRTGDAPRKRHIGARGEVIIVGAGKGGVSKSTTSIMLAQAAAEAGMSVVLVDANRGQPDIAKYLRLLGAPGLKTVFDAYQESDPAAAVMKPEDYAAARERARLDPTPFGVVLGPPSDLADPRYASARVYGDIVDYARSIADLVVIDTQIAEASKSDLWSDMLIPLLSSDAWFLGITDESGPGASNLVDRLLEIRERGVSSARTLILAAKHLSFDEEHLEFYTKRFADLGKVIGSTGYDDDFHMRIKLGEIDSESPSIRPTINSILYQVTGRDSLKPEPVQLSGRGAAKKAKPEKSGGLFSGLFAKKKK